MSRATVEVKSELELEAQPASGNALLVVVSLGMAFLLIVALLGVAKSGNLFSESNLLYVSLILYSGATALYIGFGVTGIDRYVKVASLVTMIADFVPPPRPQVIAGTSLDIRLSPASTKCCSASSGPSPDSRCLRNESSK